MLPIYTRIKQVLTQGTMTEGEATAIAFMLLEEKAGLSRLQVLTEKEADTDVELLLSIARQIAQGTPVQYALGSARFCGLTLHVGPGVLIPRPETEELVEWATEAIQQLPTPAPSILDIGTGSGCIAITLAKRFPEAKVTATDISPDALRIARQNAQTQGVAIDFIQHDILASPPCPPPSQPPPSSLCPPSPPCPPSSLRPLCDVVVSNPPYVCDSEAAQMERNVLDHEPHQALFVPDTRPLLFYDAIARQARHLLAPGGHLFFEINRRFGHELTTLLHTLGYTHIELRQDQFGNDRMIKATLEG